MSGRAASPGWEAKREEAPPEVPGGEPGTDAVLDKAGLGGGGIRCPRCAWRPRAEDRWSCTCGHAWNTFDTRGRVPGVLPPVDGNPVPPLPPLLPHEAWYAGEQRDG